jgi:hypothetical protein
MERVALYDQTTDYVDDSAMSWNVGQYYELFVCPKCKKITLRSCWFHEGRDPDDWVFKTLYPLPDKIPLGLPSLIKDCFKEALKIKTISPNAYGVMLGRVLELVCQDRNADGKTLFAQLQDLAARGEIPNSIVEISHNLRDLRNIGAHATLGSLTEDEVPILDDLCRAILEYVYSGPKLIDRARAKSREIKSATKKSDNRED